MHFLVAAQGRGAHGQCLRRGLQRPEPLAPSLAGSGVCVLRAAKNQPSRLAWKWPPGGRGRAAANCRQVSRHPTPPPWLLLPTLTPCRTPCSGEPRAQIGLPPQWPPEASMAFRTHLPPGQGHSLRVFLVQHSGNRYGLTSLWRLIPYLCDGSVTMS